MSPLVLVSIEWNFRGLENVTRASVDIEASSEWVKFQFPVTYPFKTVKLS